MRCSPALDWRIEMPAIVVVGAQWGDEGKGRITDYLAQSADTVVRYQGGNNAGHTVVVGGSTYRFHLIPSGMLHAGRTCVLGNGVVVDGAKLVEELDALEAHGIDTGRLKLSDQAHFILPTHALLDRLAEERRGGAKIGTTGRGIGPAYRDKVNRCGVRVGDAADPQWLASRVETHLRDHEHELVGSRWTVDRLVQHVREAWKRLERHVCDTSTLVNEKLDCGARVLLEGAQGTLLDVDHGTYPFVTSSNPVAGGACIGAGIGPTRIDRVLGVAKAYATRVGSGPFPTELGDATGGRLRALGAEYGTTTGRPRRCGWVDAVALRYAVRVNGIDHLAVTKLDVLDDFTELKVCTAYRVRGRETRDFPSNVRDLECAEPVYESVPGWRVPTGEVRSWTDLPAQAAAYITHLESLLRVPVALVSVGAERGAILGRLAIWEGM